MPLRHIFIVIIIIIIIIIMQFAQGNKFIKLIFSFSQKEKLASVSCGLRELSGIYKIQNVMGDIKSKPCTYMYM